MRISLLLAIMSISHLFAGNVASQTLSLNINEMSVRDVLREIERQSQYSFFYNDSFSDLNKTVNIAAETENIDDMMYSVLAGTNLTYRILEDNLIVIAPDQREVQDQIVVTGTVTDARDGMSLPGVSIQVQGTAVGTVTDVDGQYEITVGPDATLVFSFIGMESKEVVVGDQRVINIQLESASIGLGEVVISGYSVRQRSMPTGAISRMVGDDFRESLIQTPDQALQGRMSGVMVSHASGQPGSGLLVQVRGRGSITASSSPIYIVDGVQVTTYTSATVEDNPLSGINPNDIESIEVLKDASATAMYGAQGANGVVLITTNQARRGETNINVSSQFGFNEQPALLDIMDGPTWTETMIQGYVNYFVDRGEDPDVRRQMAIERYGDPATAPTYDWQDALFRAGALRNISVSASSGLENTNVYFSGSYDFEEGPVLASDFQSFRFRSNIDHTFSERFTLATRISAASSTANGLATGRAYINSPFHGGYTQRPIDAIYTEDGGYNHNDFIRINLVQQAEENIRQAKTNQLRGSVTGVYEISDRLSFRTLWGMDYRTVRDRSYTSALLPRYADDGGRLSERYRQEVAFNTNQLLEFEETFDMHTINLLGGFEYRQNDRESIRASAQQFPNPIFTQLDLAAEMTGMSGRTSQSKFAGFFSRADYSYDDRYIVTANIRYDGSSRFGAENQWGLFYSGALAWNMAREAFMANVDFVNQLTLRTSFGITGNSGISDFASRSLFGSGGTYEGATGLRPSGLGNDLLTWEEAQTLDLGFEFSVWENRLFGSLNYFNTRNKNLLLNAWLPTDSGFSSITRNSGVVENIGWEVELGSRLLAVGDFSWTSNFNFTHQKNEILELVDGADILGSSTRVGYPIDIRWHMKYAGVNPADGRVFWYDLDGELTYRRSSSQYQHIGNYSPDFFGGFSNDFTYKNYRLSVLFQYEYGRGTYNSTIGRRMHSVNTERGLMNAVAEAAWQQPGDMTWLPRHYISSSFPGSSSHYNSSLWWRDASYIRLKEVRFDYIIPARWLERMSLNSAALFAQARNLLTWTNYPHGDPEMVGTATGDYPQSRQITMGINVQF